MTKTITLNIGGKTFETTADTLQGSAYFQSYLDRWHHTSEPIFVDRSFENFHHVLELLRFPDYDFPEDYLYELDFYQIPKPANIKKNVQSKFQDLKCHYDILMGEYWELKDKYQSLKDKLKTKKKPFKVFKTPAPLPNPHDHPPICACYMCQDASFHLSKC